MLAAFAIENLLKARIVRRDRAKLEQEFQNKQRLPSTLKSHDLCKLAVRAGKQSLADGYEDILKRLTRSATWYGRYPVPLDPSGLASFSGSSDGSPISLAHYSNDDRKEIEQVLKEVQPLKQRLIDPRLPT